MNDGWRLTLRSRDAEGTASDREARWAPDRTAAVLCDLWDRHWCAGANRRVEEMAPTVDRLLRTLRESGALIVHAPSDTMAFYAQTPARRRAQAAPAALTLLPNVWHPLDPAKEGALPIDDSDGGCDDEPPCPQHGAWTRQHPAVAVSDDDAVSDDGQEVVNLFRDRGIENVFVLGVHTNMCVLGRSFGIRRLTGEGFQIALVRDLTDTMYNPRRPPQVSHHEGTALVVAHIERHWCPTVTSDQILGGAPFRFSDAPSSREERR